MNKSITNLSWRRTFSSTEAFVLYTAEPATTQVAVAPPASQPATGPAAGRALAFLAHQHLGTAFGTVYDVSTVATRCQAPHDKISVIKVDRGSPQDAAVDVGAQPPRVECP